MEVGDTTVLSGGVHVIVGTNPEITKDDTSRLNLRN